VLGLKKGVLPTCGGFLPFIAPWLGIFLKIEDNGVTSLTHHLPTGFVGNISLASASASGCRLVVADSTSRKLT